MTAATTLPPGPRGAVHLRSMRDAPLQFITETARTYGDITCHHADGDTIYMLNRPDLARYVLKENGANYTKLRTPDDNMLRPLLGNGLLTSNGSVWAEQRRMCAPAFRPSAVVSFDTVITDAATHLLTRWQPAISSGTAIEVDHQLTSLTLSIIVRAMLGADIDGIGEGFGRAVDAVNRYIGHYVPPDDPDPADTAQRRAGFMQARAFLDAVTRALIASRRAVGGDGSDLLGAMLQSGHVMSDAELRDQVLTIIMAGHETTAKSLTWTLYLLDQNPVEAARVYDEVDRVLGGRVPTSSDLPSLPVCQRAIKEAMRLYPAGVADLATGPGRGRD